MMDTDNKSYNQVPPLAERLRPVEISDYIGQQHLIGEHSVLRRAIASGNIPSMILWGPPGVGKTTLALIISRVINRHAFTLSAVTSGVKDIRTITDYAEKNGNVILIIDEIHRFNKSQQDSLLAAVEKGLVTLIGATTENPSFEVITPLLSRCQVYILRELEENDLLVLLDRACKEESRRTGKEIIVVENEALLRLSGGDARKMLNALELVVNNITDDTVTVTNDIVFSCIQKNHAIYDKGGEMHYDIISAFIKSIRGSDPNAAVYWLARMIEGGEDPKFIARRMLILASEDIGNANPNALLLATSCFQAVTMIGYPECRLTLSQTAIYLAVSPKSNASYLAIGKAQEAIRKHGNLPVPLPLRNAPTKLMKKMDYGKDYKYAHNYDNNFAEQEFLPEGIADTSFYIPQNNAREKEIKERLKLLWKNKYKL